MEVRGTTTRTAIVSPAMIAVEVAVAEVETKEVVVDMEAAATGRRTTQMTTANRYVTRTLLESLMNGNVR